MNLLLKGRVVKMNNRLINAFIIFWITIIPVFGQEPVNHLKKEISINLNEVELRSALPKLGEAGDFQFSYNASIIPGDSLVSIVANNKSLDKVLDDLLGSKIRSKVLGNHVILLANNNKKASKTDSEIQYTISGYIYDALSGEIISQASIYEIDGRLVSATNQEGFYSLNLPDEDKRMVSFSKYGYNDTIIVVRPSEQPLNNILLVPKPVQPEETALLGLPPTSVHERKLVAVLVPAESITASENIPVIEERFFQVSLFPFVGSNRSATGLITNRLSLNVFAGYSKGVRGLELGSFLNINRKDVKGVQLCGFGNMVGGDTYGVQMAGFFNVNSGSFTGLQTAGFSNLVMDTIRGVQLAGFSNALRGPMYGSQISGFANFTSQNVDGAQISGFLNIAGKDVKVAQISGFANYCRNVGGLQLAGFSNIASGTTSGLQVAGFINFAKEVDGFQLSFINVSDTVGSGMPIGFLSFVLKGYHTIEVTADELFWANASFKTGVRKFYNIITAGMNDEWFQGGYGLGTQIRFSDRWRMSFDLTSSYLISKEKPEELSGFLHKFSPKLDFKLFKYLTVTAGPSLNAFTNRTSSLTETSELPIMTSYPLQDKYFGDLRLRVWIGASIGIRI